jgi:hypothetical protein
MNDSNNLKNESDKDSYKDSYKDSEINSNLKWNTSIDKMLENWADNAKCYEWMYTESYSRYNFRSTAMTITVNVAIAFSGITNLIVGTPTQYTNVSPSTIIGCVSIGISIISMLQDKLDWITLANNFKQASQQWGIISRKIIEQVSLPWQGRKDCGTFLKYIRADINQISQYNSSIPKDIREACNKKFGKIPHFDIPDICGQLEHTTGYVNDTNIITKINIPDKSGIFDPKIEYINDLKNCNTTTSIVSNV